MHHSSNIYTHYSSDSDPSNVRRVTATDISITEVDEPCELHDKYHCKQCIEAAEKKFNKVLKRSISSNAVGNTPRRRSMMNLHRTLSQTSCYSTGSTEQRYYQEDIIDDSLYARDGSFDKERNNMVWDNLSSEAKDIIVKRLLSRQQSSSRNSLVYEDLTSEFESSWNAAPPRGRKHVKVTGTHHKQNHSGRSRKSRDLSNIVGEVYNDLLMKNLVNESGPMDITQERYETSSANLPHLRQITQNRRNNGTFERESLEIALGNYQLDKKIQELNGILAKLEHYSPLPTPVSTGTQNSAVHTCHKENDEIHRSNQHNTRSIKCYEVADTSSILSRIAMKSKLFMTKLKYKSKKKKAALDLYRVPHPHL